MSKLLLRLAVLCTKLSPAEMDLVRLLTLELMLLLLRPRDFGLLGVGLRFCSPTAMECLLDVGDGGSAVVPSIFV